MFSNFPLSLQEVQTDLSAEKWKRKLTQTIHDSNKHFIQDVAPKQCISKKGEPPCKRHKTEQSGKTYFRQKYAFFTYAHN